MLELKNISMNVGKENKDILSDVSFSFDRKKLYVITGPNGGGKSSLAKIIMGIYDATDGQILFEGEDITHYDITQRANLGIGYAFQQPPRFKGIKVRDLLKMAAGGQADHQYMCKLLQDVGLCSQDYIDRDVDDSLSGGELKRIEIATIMARKLKVAVFDEPEAGIDLWSFQKLAETFKNIHDKYDTTIVIISHQERILNLADEVIVMAEGKVKEVTSKEQFFADMERDELDCMCGLDCVKGVDKNVELIG
ncbi:ATP-binding cassette domain-containing protein [Alkalibacter rhizosphaerae]|uniref:ATP-binding cassette domain-containing protein n=1 Tax=Alkalibacter rhizosphaerae TaxID=2815577 RepID=A0A974XE91_9FIRM|nr:ATP-binding cassette domain-containing protein [Alkalibacter rhizosphaerae]QSX08076.1 ATP-binding cassette domain-containing protein [Alkalibacter rhizosphaerae]